MPTFPTPTPIRVDVDVIGDIRITASDRTDTVVSVRPGNPSSNADVKVAQQTSVEFADGRLTVKSPKDWRRYTPFGGKETLDVVIDLPTGSTVTAETAFGHISADGELGDCRLKTTMGSVVVDECGALHAKTGFGDLAVDHVAGAAELTTGSGRVRIGVVDGAAVVKNSNGETGIGEVGGDVRVKAANGDITVGRAGASVVAKTASGNVRIGEVAQGTTVAETAAGDLEIGVRRGTAAWLDVHTSFGTVRNNLDAADEPSAAERTVEVRARTSAGSIVVRRSANPDSPTD